MGELAESAVADFVTNLGWQVLDRNRHAGHYEIDIIAKDSRTLVIIEVRFRSERSLTSGFGSLSPTKRNRVRRAGERLWHARYRHDRTVDRMRFDAASVHVEHDGTLTVEYALAAF
jgi:putative endonuclease